MKGQIIFYSFLPGVTAAVLTTQPTWAQQVVNPSISTPVEGGDLVAENTSSVTNLPTTTKPVALGELKTINMQWFATQDVNKIATKTVALPIGKISFQDVPSVFSLAANPY
ncbi:hypothetical protein CEN47_13820, partial [Fischerella thermalis CCMEE 5319]